MPKALEKKKKKQWLKINEKSQVKSIADHKKKLVESNAFIKKNDYGTKNKLFLNKKEFYDKFFDERNNEISTLNKKTKFDKLMY